MRCSRQAAATRMDAPKSVRNALRLATCQSTDYPQTSVVTLDAGVTRFRPGNNTAVAAATTRRWTTAAVWLTATVALTLAASIWVTYYRYQPLWVEHAAYGMWANLQFHDVLVREGYISAFTKSLGTRHILQPVVLGLVPRTLASPHAHLVITAFALYLFVFLLARYVLQRTGDARLGAAAVLLFCTLPGLYDETHGMGVPWPDYQSMFFLSSAVLSMGLWIVSRRTAWLGLAGANVTLATLARDTGAIYAAVTIGPPLAWLLLREFIRAGWRQTVRSMLWFAVPAFPTGWLLAHKVEFFRQYYMTSNALQLRQPLGIVIPSILASNVAFCGVILLVLLGIQVAVALLWPRDRWRMADALAIYWPISYTSFLVVNGYNATSVTKEVMYTAPGLVCFAVTMRGGMDFRHKGVRLLMGSALVICLFACSIAITHAYGRARHPDPKAAALREDQRALAEALASLPQQVWWHSYSNYDWGTVISALTFYDFGRYQPSENMWFHNKKSYWDANFPGRDLANLQYYIRNEAERRVDVAIVFRDADNKPDGMEDYSFSIASSLATRLKRDSDWKHYRDVPTSVSGPLSLYINQRRTER